MHSNFSSYSIILPQGVLGFWGRVVQTELAAEPVERGPDSLERYTARPERMQRVRLGQPDERHARRSVRSRDGSDERSVLDPTRQSGIRDAQEASSLSPGVERIGEPINSGSSHS